MRAYAHVPPRKSPAALRQREKQKANGVSSPPGSHLLAGHVWGRVWHRLPVLPSPACLAADPADRGSTGCVLRAGGRSHFCPLGIVHAACTRGPNAVGCGVARGDSICGIGTSELLWRGGSVAARHTGAHGAGSTRTGSPRAGAGDPGCSARGDWRPGGLLDGWQRCGLVELHVICWLGRQVLLDLVAVVCSREVALEHVEVAGHLDGLQHLVGLHLLHRLQLDLLLHLPDNVRVEDLGQCEAVLGAGAQQLAHHARQIRAVLAGDGRELAPEDLVAQLAHRPGLEGHCEGGHLVEDAAQGPHIRGKGVWPALPDLRGHVVRRADLSLGHGVLEHLGNTQVPNLEDPPLTHHDVAGLDVTVEDLHLVESIDATGDLNEVVPDLGLAEGLAGHLLLLDNVGEVALRGVLHHNAQLVAVEEGLIVRHDVGMLRRGQQPDLVDSLLALSLAHRLDVHLLDGVDLAIGNALDLVYRSEAPLTQEFEHLEVLQQLTVAAGESSTGSHCVLICAEESTTYLSRTVSLRLLFWLSVTLA
mmetsp:Transcript_3661/g.10534  ORF Transcript_3661/g.10534 Transcript_3661/m.10534 type:complete len:532 (+) Transcript_3661:287-1882(+)